MKSKVHYVLVKASFKKAVTGAQAMSEIRDLAALSYEEHYGSGHQGGPDDNVFKLKAAKLASVPAKSRAPR